MAAPRAQVLWSRLRHLQRWPRSFSTSRPVNNTMNSAGNGEDNRGIIRRIVTNWKTPSLVWIGAVCGCLFYERFIEEPDPTGTREPLITRLMVEYLMSDPDTEKQKRDNHLRQMRQRCDAYLERRRKPQYGVKPFDLQEIDRHTPKAPELGPDGF